MKVSYDWLQGYFDRPLPQPKKLADIFTFHAFEVEGIEEKVGEEKDTVMDLKVLPDRAHYALSHRGIAGEVSVLTKIPLKNDLEFGSIVRTASDVGIPVSLNRTPKVTIEAPHFCRRFTGRFVEDISVDKAKDKTEEKKVPVFLTAIGQRSISPIVDITNFVMFDIGQPTHAFDADKIEGDIVIRAAKVGEKITLLDGKEYTLTVGDHVIADEAGPLDIAGVKGGKRAEVTLATRNILLTSANFEPSAIRRTSTRFNLRNEASKRFENEITPELAIEGLHALSVHLQAVAPESRFGSVVDEYPIKAIRKEISINPAYISERLGVSIPEETMKDILGRMGITLAAKGNTWLLTIPFLRLDLNIPQDIVEEVGRVYGYEHIAGKLPPFSSVASSSKVSHSEKEVETDIFCISEEIKDILVEVGFSEVYLYTLVAKGDIEVAYPLASDKAALRVSLAAGMTKCLEMNAHNADLLGLEAIRIFEIGKVFTKENTKESVGSHHKETLVLALGATQVKKIKGRDGKSLINDAVKKLSDTFGIELPIKSFLSSGPNAVCEIEIDSILVLGKAQKNAGRITFKKPSAVSYKPFSLYPFIVRDIALFVPDTVSGDAVWAEIEKTIQTEDAVGLIARHALFDTFKKDGKTSYAFRIIFQSFERTLTDIEVNTVMEKIYAHMTAQGWGIR